MEDIEKGGNAEGDLEAVNNVHSGSTTVVKPNGGASSGGSAVPASSASGVDLRRVPSRSILAEGQQFLTHQWRSIRPWTLFLSPRRFNIPKLQDLGTRVLRNISFFMTNYLIVGLLMASSIVFFHYTFVVSIVIVSSLWLYFFMVQKDPLVILGARISSVQKLVGLIILSVAIFWLFSSALVLAVVSAVTAGVVMLHATTWDYLAAPVDLAALGLR